MTEDLTKTHSYLPKLVEQLKGGRVDRREFLRTATLLGLSAGAAYGLAGVPLSIATSRPAQAAGGIVRSRIACRRSTIRTPSPGVHHQHRAPVPRLSDPHRFDGITHPCCWRSGSRAKTSRPGP